jgi:hypothetical protein
MSAILSTAKNPEGDDSVIQANILWILHSALNDHRLKAGGFKPGSWN